MKIKKKQQAQTKNGPITQNLKLTKKKKKNKKKQISLSARQTTLLHRNSLVEYQPAAVAALSVCQDGTILAVLKENGAIELWDTAVLTLIQTIKPRIRCKWSACTWVQDPQLQHSARLITSDLYGTLYEWAPHSLTHTQRVQIEGGAVYDVKAWPYQQGDTHSSLALACNDGTCKLYDIEHGESSCNYVSTMPRVNGKCLSVAWHPSRTCVYVGNSTGTVHAWSVADGKELYRINVESFNKTCIHAMICVPPPQGGGGCTLVTGDSAGCVSFFEDQYGTMVKQYKKHDADVLTLTATTDGDHVFAAGVDPRPRQYSRKSREGGAGGGGGYDDWVFVATRHTITHDVRAAAVICNSFLDATSASSPEDAVANPPEPGLSPLVVFGGTDACVHVLPVRDFGSESAFPRVLSRVPDRPKVHVVPSWNTDGKDKHRQLLLGLRSGPPPNQEDEVEQIGDGRDQLYNNRDGLFTCSYGTHVDVWAAGTAACVDEGPSSPTSTSPPRVENGTPALITHPPTLLTRVKLASEHLITGSSTSSCGAFVAISDSVSTRVFALLTTAVGTVVPKKLKIVHSQLPGDGEGGKPTFPPAGLIVFADVAGDVPAADRACWLLTKHAQGVVLAHVSLSGIRLVTRIDDVALTNSLRDQYTPSYITNMCYNSMPGREPGALQVHRGDCLREFHRKKRYETRMIALASDEGREQQAVYSKGVMGGVGQGLHGENIDPSLPPPPPRPPPASLLWHPQVTAIAASDTAKQFAVARLRGITLYQLSSGKEIGELPSLGGGSNSKVQCINVLKYTPNGAKLLAITNTGSILLYNVANLSADGWYTRHHKNLPHKFTCMPGEVLDVVFKPDLTINHALLYTPSAFCNISFDHKPSMGGQGKANKDGKGGRRGSGTGDNMFTVTVKNVVLGMGWCDNDDVMICERDWAEVASKFDEPLYQHKFGS